MDILNFLQDGSIPGGWWGLILLVFTALNLKHLPFVWHIRLFTPLFRHQFFSRERPYLDTLSEPSKEDNQKGSFSFALGTVTCQFKREISPYQQYEMWTRVLSWDRKWLYLVTQIIAADKVKPRSYTLQPWKKGASDPRVRNPSDGTEINLAILATSIARYVFKRSRVTIPVNTILTAAGLLPGKPDDISLAQTSTLEAKSTNPIAERSAVENGGTETVKEVPLKLASGSDIWDWERIEEERLRGWRIAQLVAGLDSAQEVFTGDSQPALGKY